MDDDDRVGSFRFARYAYPPNELGYCGPSDWARQLEELSNQHGAYDLAVWARRFEGAWPYLQMIATANGNLDPLDERVVEAYWIGNELLEQPAASGTLPHHSFHVFAVYPWLGVLRSGRVTEPLRVLDQCRIRWGRVEEVLGNTAVVQTRPLTWDGSRLGYGGLQGETVTWAADGLEMVDRVRVGDSVSLHWNWICDRLDERQQEDLERYSAFSLDFVNHVGDHTGS